MASLLGTHGGSISAGSIQESARWGWPPATLLGKPVADEDTAGGPIDIMGGWPAKRLPSTGLAGALGRIGSEYASGRKSLA